MKEKEEKNKKSGWMFLAAVNLLSVIWTAVSFFVFNKYIFSLGVILYVVSLIVIYIIKIRIFSDEYGIWKFLIFLVPLVIISKAETYFMLQPQNMLMAISGVVTLIALLLILIRFKNEIKIAIGIISAVWCLISFFSFTAAVTVSNALFDTTPKSERECPIVSIEYMKGGASGVTAYVDVELINSEDSPIIYEISIPDYAAKNLEVGDTLTLEFGSGFWNMEYFTIE
ncbi:MAG: hypothetical protein ACI4IJ_00655 [Acutalibacteraceae bacterium]